MQKGGSRAASTAAITTGRYSGLQPASTALMATFSTVTGTRFGGTSPSTSAESRAVPSSMRATRSGVGGTTGRPSLQPRSKSASWMSSSCPRVTRRAARRSARSRSLWGGVTDREAQPGRRAGSSAPRAGSLRMLCQAARSQPSQRATSSSPEKAMRAGTISTPRSKEAFSVTSCWTPDTAGKAGSSWLQSATASRGARASSTGAMSWQVGQSAFTTTT